MKSGKFILIFIALSLILHLSLIFISLEPSKSEPSRELKKLIPVNLAMKAQSEPPTAAPPAPIEPKALPPQPAKPVPVRPEPVEPAIVKPSPIPVVTTVPEPAANPGPEPSAEPAAAPTTPQTSVLPDSNPGAQTGTTGEQNDNIFEGLINRIKMYTDSTYPLKAKKRGLQGVIYVRLILDEEGNMIRTEIIEPSPYQSLNAAAIKLIYKAMETPYPHNLGRNVSLPIPVTYRLK
ncbi:MAG: TonB family protein [Spirochaetales bacterium]|nr:TonB family protein [Spirochaetales bacterium]